MCFGRIGANLWEEKFGCYRFSGFFCCNRLARLRKLKRSVREGTSDAAAMRLPDADGTNPDLFTMPVRFSDSFRWLGALLLTAVMFAVVSGQDDPKPPASRPPVLDDGLSTAVFYLLDEDGNRVMMPGMTLAELERLQKLDEGFARPTQPFSFQSLEISGKAIDSRAELNVTVKLEVEPIAGGSVGVPLQMGNFHLLAPPDVSGVEDARLEFDGLTEGYMLWLKVDKPRVVQVEMRVVALIEVAGRSSLELRLPASPTTVKLEVRGSEVTARTEGRGDEVVRALEQSGEQTELVVESSGSDFTLTWGQANRVEQPGQVLSAESLWAIRWLSSDEPPTASIDLTVTNLRGDLQAFELEMPAGMRMLEQLGSEIVAAGAPQRYPEGQRLRVIPDPAITGDEIKLQFEVELIGEEISEQTPLRLQGIDVVDAVSQGGEIEIRSDEDYRLRWDRRPWVRATVGMGRSGTEPAMYRFQFDRVPFELPMWLTARQRRLQVDPQFNIRLRSTLAELTLTIRISGATTDGRVMPIDMRGWNVQSISDRTADRSLESMAEGSVEEIDLSSLATTNSEEATIQIQAVRPIPVDEPRIDLSLPRIVSDDSRMLIQPGPLMVQTEPGLTLVADLADSLNIDRVARVQADSPSEEALQFEVQTLAPESRLVGFLEQDRPRVTLQAEAEISVEDGSLLTALTWRLESQRELAGKIPLSLTSEDDWRHWSVTVNDEPAVLQLDNDGRVVLVAEGLRGKSQQVRLRHQAMIDPQASLPADLEVLLPRPDLPDLTTLGEVPIRLVGSAGLEVDTDVAGSPQSELTLDALPSRPLAVRLRQRVLQQQRIVMSRVMLTTQCGRGRRYERLLATVSGSGTLQIPLRAEMPNLTVDLKVNDQPLPAIRGTDGELSIALPVDQLQHTIDLQLWFGQEASSLGTRVEPAIGVPVGVGQMYWNLVLPADQHVLWASPTLGRAMRWSFDRWRLRRVPTDTEASVAAWAGGNSRDQVTIGNRYLFLGSDAASIQIVALGRATIWATVGGLILLVATLLVSVQRLRSPLMVVVGAVAICGLTLLAPDAAVLVGQLALLAMALVAVMLGVRAALQARPHERLLDSSRKLSRDGSTQSIQGNAGGAAMARGSSRAQPVPVTSAAGDDA